MRYSDIRLELKTGDVIAFSGKGLVSNLIKWKTDSDISHVGIVLDTSVENLGKVVFLIESTTLVTIPDAITKELWKGVQIHTLSNRVNTYDGKMWVYPLKYPLAEDKKNAMQAWLRKKHYKRTPYDTVQALGSGIDLLSDTLTGNEQDFSQLFCSELVVKALQIGGVIGYNRV